MKTRHVILKLNLDKLYSEASEHVTHKTFYQCLICGCGYMKQYNMIEHIDEHSTASILGYLETHPARMQYVIVKIVEDDNE